MLTRKRDITSKKKPMCIRACRLLSFLVHGNPLSANLHILDFIQPVVRKMPLVDPLPPHLIADFFQELIFRNNDVLAAIAILAFIQKLHRKYY